MVCTFDATNGYEVARINIEISRNNKNNIFHYKGMFNKTLLTLHLRELHYIVTAVMISKEPLRILVTTVNLCCPIQ